MSLGIGSLGPTHHYSSHPAGEPRFRATVASETVTTGNGMDSVQLSVGAPPAELQPEIDFAYERALELAAHNRELHFAMDEESGRVIVQVRELDGTVIRTIPAKHALDVMGGAELI